MPLQFLETIPILRIFDVTKAKEFYVGFLGFTVVWEHRFDEKAPLYMEVSLSGLKLHLSEHHGDGCPGSTTFIRVRGLSEYHAEIMAKGYGYLRPGIIETEHQSRGLNLTDPFGNHLRLDESFK